jgi:predicted TPR repeat methyltransferase
LKPYARHLAGCDLSAGMLRRAQARGVYQVLHQDELVFYLDTLPAHFDAVVSADTLCYFGALEAAMAAAARSLRPGGWLVFTVEALAEGDPASHRLQPNGRYAHGADYLRAVMAGAGLTQLTLRAEALRLEAGKPVAGWLVAARNHPG